MNNENSGRLIRTGPGREIRHLNHLLMEPVMLSLYRIITGRIERNKITGVVTGSVISYYRFLKKRYVHNYFRAHPWERA